MIDARVLGVAVAGLGVGERHARAFARLPCCRLLHLFDIEADRARRLAAEFPGCRVAPSYEAMLEDSAVDVVVIASFDDAHFDQVVQALRADKHVFVEKPICRTGEELAQIKECWQAMGRRKLRSNLVLRAAPLYRWLRDCIAAGDFGSIYSFDGDYLYGRLHKLLGGWRGDMKDYSVLEGGGVHLIDLMLWLTRERPVWATAAGNRVCTTGTGFRYNDFVAATLGFDSGMVARITANFGCVHRHQHVMRVFGTTASFLYDDAGARVHRSRDPLESATHIHQSPLPEDKGDLVPQFVAAVLGDAEDAEETQSVFDGISVCIAADRAVTSGKKERIEYV